MHWLGRLLELKAGSHGGGQGFIWVSHIPNFSTKAGSSDVMVNYLMSSLGFSEEEAIATSSKVRPFKTPKKTAAVVDSFKESGLDEPQIKKIIFEGPNVLSCNPQITIKPRLKILQDLGLSGSDLAMAICVNRQIWSAALESRLKPRFQYLKTIVNDKTLCKALTKTSYLLHYHARSNLPCIVALLQDYGFSSDNLEDLMLNKPKIFIMNPQRVHDILATVENKLQVPRNSAGFYRRFCALTSLSEKTIESKIETYKSFGFTESDVWALARKIPVNLKLSETKIRDGLNFFINVLGFEPSYIISWPILLAFNLEKRVIPRYTFLKGLKEKGLLKPDLSLAYCISRDERTFLQFMLRFKDKVPDLCEDYVRSMSSHLHIQDAELTAT